MNFRVQVGGCDPDSWTWVEAHDMRHAAARAGAGRGLGERRVYVVEPGSPSYPNGAPMVVHGFDLSVNAREVTP